MDLFEVWLCVWKHCRKDSFITHRSFCDALAEESARTTAKQLELGGTNPVFQSQSLLPFQFQSQVFMNTWDPSQENPNPSALGAPQLQIKPEAQSFQSQIPTPTSFVQEQQHKSTMNSALRTLHLPPNAATSTHLSATALLQKAATVGASAITGPAAAVGPHSTMGHVTQSQPSVAEFGSVSLSPDYMRGFMTRSLKSERLTRDFLGLTAHANGAGRNGGALDVSVNARDMLSFMGGVEYLPYDYHHHHLLFKSQQGFGFLGTNSAPETWGASWDKQESYSKRPRVKWANPYSAFSL